MTVNNGAELKVVVTISMPGLTVAQNVYYVRYTGVNPADEEDVVDDMKLWADDMYGNILSVLADTVSISEVAVSTKLQAEPLSFEEIGTVPSTQVGTALDPILPNGVAVVMRVATSAVKSLARKYIAGISDGFNIGAVWDSNVLSSSASFLFDWIAGPATVGDRSYVAGIVSTKDGFFKTFPGAGILSTIPGYQRRRKPGVGI